MIVIVGMAGAGKSTQCRRLSEEKGYQCLSVGELLRRTETGDNRAEMIRGAVLNDAVVTPIVKKELMRLGDAPEILLDGCPRTEGQALWLASETSPKTRAVLHLIISDDVALERLKLRDREDDTEEAMRLRFSGYHRDIGAVLDAFRAQSIPVMEIDANQDQATVYNEIVMKLTGL